jgi:hypothetical protein
METQPTSILELILPKIHIGILDTTAGGANNPVFIIKIVLNMKNQIILIWMIICI